MTDSIDVDTPDETSSSGYIDVDRLAPQVNWDEFYEFFKNDWRQGQHIAIIAPTDTGKTTLALWLLPLMKFVVVFATKPRDKTLDKLLDKKSKLAHIVGNFTLFRSWKKGNPKKTPKRLLWPEAKDLYAAGNQQREFQQALQQIYYDGGWSVYLDELWFMASVLKLEQEVRIYLQQSRSNYITLIVSSQRPSRIPLEVYDQSRHLFFGRDNDERNLSRISGISWISAGVIKYIVAHLRPHEFLYINTLTGFMCRIICPPLD